MRAAHGLVLALLLALPALLAAAQEIPDEITDDTTVTRVLVEAARALVKGTATTVGSQGFPFHEVEE